jgi:type II secretory pathway predicted ATPase ExeA
MTAYRRRFGLAHDPLPRDAVGKTYFDADEHYGRLRRTFTYLASEPGLGVLTGDAGSGKTAALRNLCDALPEPEYRIVYICDTAVTPAAVYRNLAAALGLQPARNRDALWRQLKTTIEHLVDVESVIPILVIDEAQHLPDSFFLDLAGFLNRNFDRRELLTVWLVGLPSLAARLGMRQHAALNSRVVSTNVMPPRERDAFMAMVDHGLKIAGAKTKLLSDQAIEVLWRVSHGLPRHASRLLRASLMLAHERDQSFVDERVMLDACEELQLGRPTVSQGNAESTQSRDERGTKSRK